MEEPIAFTVRGEPKAQPRAKAAGRGNFVHIYTPATAKQWKGLVASAAKPFVSEEPIDGPLHLKTTFFMPRPKAHYLKAGLRKDAPYWHTNKPDSDNLEKAVMDAITDTGLWRDDSVVCSKECRKLYAPRPEDVGCVVLISRPYTNP